MSYSNFEGIFFDDISMAVNNTSSTFCGEYVSMGAIQLDWSGADFLDGYIEAEVTAGLGLGATDFVWSYLSNTRIYFDSASGNCFYQLPVAAYKRIRLKYYAGSNTAGTLRATYIFKSYK